MIIRIVFSGMLSAITMLSHAENVYHYHVSLVDNFAGEDSLATQYTRIPNWIGLIAAEDGQIYNIDAEFSLGQSLPGVPGFGNNYPDANDNGTDIDTWPEVDAANITTVLYNPDNFTYTETWDTNYVPATINMTYQAKLEQMIDAWTANTNDTIKFRVFVGGLTLDGISNNYPISAGEYITWKTDTLGDYKTFWDTILAAVKASRPSADIELIKASEVYVKLMNNTALSSLTFENAFNDGAPHFNETGAYIMSMIYYVTVFQRPVPVSFTPPVSTTINATLTSNIQAVKDYIYNEVVGAVPVSVSFGGSLKFGGGEIKF